MGAPTWQALNKARAKGGFSKMGIWFFLAISLILSAITLSPLATTTGAGMSFLYLSATATWVGLVTTTSALGTASNILRRAISLCSWRIRALIIGSPSDCLYSSLTSCFVIFKLSSYSHFW